MKIFKKIPKEIYIYILWGILVGAVNVGSLAIFMYKIGFNEITSNILSWILYNLVSFITNRKMVFHTETKNAREFIVELINFYFSRGFTLIIETLIMFVFVTILSWWALGVKIFTAILMIFINYFISKHFVFKRRIKLHMENKEQQVD